MALTSATAAAILCFWLFFSAIRSFTFCHGTLTSELCQPRERQALLDLKAGLVDPSDWLKSWSGRDCCKWSGVICNNVTGQVTELHLGAADLPEFTTFSGEISPSLASLKHLRYLDLSNNDFSGHPIPEFIGSLTNLRLLKLSTAGFSGVVPLQLGKLSKLRYLNLQGNYGEKLYLENLDWVSSLSLLEFLDLSFVDLSGVVNWLTMLNKIPSLQELHLSNCQLRSIPDSLPRVNFSSLSVLDLSYNNFNDPLFPSWTFYLRSLTTLDLANNRFRGPIPEGLRNMSLLSQLDLSWNHFTTLEPNCFLGLTHMQVLSLTQNDLKGEIFLSAMQNMTSLTDLDLSYNKLKSRDGIPEYFRNFCRLRTITLSDVELRQEADEALRILAGCPADALESIRLSNCQLSGHLMNIPFRNFQKLDTLSLSRNLISGRVPLSLTDLVSLRTLDLSSNKLVGPLPSNLGRLSKLESIDISENSLEGEVAEFHFQNLTRLWLFQASGNQLSLKVGPSWNPPPQIEILGMGFWHLGPQFPNWIRSLKLLTELNMSSSGISSSIPPWLFFNSHFYSIDLSSNLLNGPLPHIYPFMTVLDVSNNSLSGSLAKFLCYKPDEEKTMQVMNLGSNKFSGEIPDCWTSWRYLEALKLSSNKLKGSIPRSLGTLSFLQSLHLRNNNLTGEIPPSFANITKLVTLDCSRNKLEGLLPSWIGQRLSGMMILNLRENKFHGNIPEELCLAKSMRILDLADNNLAGNIPRCVNNFTAMVRMNDSDGVIQLSYNGSGPFFETALVVTKGKLYEYGSILKFVRSIDLSKNKLVGQIPEEMTKLAGLQSLNMSDNFLTGVIPRDIGSMGALESVDLSLNQLSGEIPPSISSMTFLSFINISSNRLTGRIPLSTQLQSLNSSSFAGNKDLCGSPLAKCRTDSTTVDSNGNGREEPDEDDGNDHEIKWFYVSLPLGFIVGFWGVVGSMVLNKQWRFGYFNFVDRLWDRLCCRL
ncbi:Receptor-like protein EIX2 [Linum perenne]